MCDAQASGLWCCVVHVHFHFHPAHAKRLIRPQRQFDLITMNEISIEELPGVGPATAEKLKDAGFNSIEAIAVASPSELAATAEIGESTAVKIIAAARTSADVGGFETGDAILERRKGDRQTQARMHRG